MGQSEGRQTEKIFETVMTEEFLHINVRCPTTDAGSSENTMLKICKKKIKRYVNILFSNYRTLKIKKIS